MRSRPHANANAKHNVRGAHPPERHGHFRHARGNLPGDDYNMPNVQHDTSTTGEHTLLFADATASDDMTTDLGAAEDCR